MIPPPPSPALTSNPKFAALYTHITTNLLSADGSPKASSATQKARKDIDQELREGYVRVAKEGLLVRGLENVVGGSEGELPEELKRLTLLILPILTSKAVLTDNHIRLLTPDLQAFQSHLPTLSTHLSKHLQHSHSTLTSLASVSPLPSQKRDPTTKQPLPSLLSSRRDTLARNHHDLEASRLALTTAAQTLLSLQMALLEQTIQALERTKHSSLSRFSKARADHLSTVAAGMAAKTQIMNHEALLGIYTPEVRGALAGYERYLEDETRRLTERERDLEGLLEEYESVKGLGEVGRRVWMVRGEIERVRRDIERLEGGG